MNDVWTTLYSWIFLGSSIALGMAWISLAPRFLLLHRGSARANAALGGLVGVTVLLSIGSISAFSTASWGLAAWFLALAIGARHRRWTACIFAGLAMMTWGLMSPFFFVTVFKPYPEELVVAMGLAFFLMLGAIPLIAMTTGVVLWFLQPPPPLPNAISK